MKLIKTLAATTAAAALFAASGAHALEITSDQTGETLASTLFLDVDGISNLQVSISGAASQFGTFTNDTGTYGLPAEGIVLSTGNVADYGDSPINSSGGNTTDFGNSASEAQEALLDPITSGGSGGGGPIFEGEEFGGDFDHFDVAQLTITFDASEDVTGVTFFGVFGSEEFPEFVGGEFIDGFGLFVNDENVAFANGDPININHPDFLGAFVDDGGFEGEGPIEVASINEGGGEVSGGEGGFPIGGEGGVITANTTLEPGDPRLAFVTGTELDGVIAPDGNPVLRFDVAVNPGTSNTFDIIIADTSDGILDSTVYLSSFQPQEIDLNDGGTEFTPLLPNDPDPNNGIFTFDLVEIENLQEIFFIDPPVSVGYVYTVQDAEFAQIQAPSLATIPDGDGFIISIAGQADQVLLGGQILDVSGLGITTFTLSGIDPALMLDPANPLAFPLGISLQNINPNLPTGVGPTISQQVLTVDVDAAVPLPAGLPLYLSALGAFFVFRRWRSA